MANKCKWKQNNREKVKKQTANWRRNNPEKIKKYRKRYYNKNKIQILKKLKEQSNTPEIRYIHYKSGAKRRKIEFKLTLEEFKTFWQKSCYYCNSKIETIGIDRIDNNNGYNILNCISCCILCNGMKRKQTIKKFISQCKKIAELH